MKEQIKRDIHTVSVYVSNKPGALARIAQVFSRRGYDTKGMKSTVVKNFKNRIIFIKNRPISISSTQLKKRAKLNI